MTASVKTDEATTLTPLAFPEILNQALFGQKLAFERIFEHFSVEATLRPAAPTRTWKKTTTTAWHSVVPREFRHRLPRQSNGL